ncbi:HAD family hydrolase [Streptomyces sp. NPDC041068]|uniref:HAD family hydrolase n=1 Tax=Streptomyces sp. NPDC041068 TaxID=3155130 RepID=UPI0033F536BB
MRRALANLRPEPRIVAAAKRARAAGVKVALLSNSFGDRALQPVRAQGDADRLLRRADPVGTGGCTEASPPVYQRALDALELMTGPECVFVDDHAENLPPAEALGIRTVHHATDPAATATVLDALLLPPPPDGRGRSRGPSASDGDPLCPLTAPRSS